VHTRTKLRATYVFWVGRRVQAAAAFLRFTPSTGLTLLGAPA
jgi:hypothetical protein